jgi:alkylation response protein AidB-like acyl-CoA dehydrogenase
VAINLAFDEAQQQRQREVHQLFAERCPTSVVRELEMGSVGYQPDLWQDLAERGWLGLTFPSSYGGGEGRFSDLYPLYEEMGRFLVPSPHLDTVVLAGDLLQNVGSETQKQRLIPAIVAGRCVLSVATLEPSGVFGPSGLTSTTAVRHDSTFVISGTKLLVAYAASADYLIVPVRTSDEGVTVFLLDAKADGISCTPLHNIAGGALYQVDFDQVAAPEDAVVGDVDDGWAPFSTSVTKAALLQTASIGGAANAVLDMTTQYAKDRHQFGNPIGSYQAVQYMVTDVLIALHSIDLLAKQAVCRIDAGLPFAREAAMAIAHGKKAAAHLHRQAHEVHAGVGFMVRHDLQLFSRRSKYWENNLGDARYHQARVASALAL